MSEQKMIDMYIEQLNINEKKALDIAKDHLETSFDISKSIGFLKFKEKINLQDSARVSDIPLP
tara:strand:+ start:488 stop:676 length:189 start_codon:yes stop_codon:yes gene_type:complete